MNYFKILVFLQRGDKTLFDIPVDIQKEYLDGLGEAADDIDRGYKQYHCQQLFVPRWKKVTFNLLSSVLVPLVFSFLFIKGLFNKKGIKVNSIIEKKGMDEVIPQIVKDVYKPNNMFWKEGLSLQVTDLSFILSLVMRSPFHPYYVFKAMMNLAYYSNMIYKHSPNTIIQFGEYSFCSSILTAYCHGHGVKHVDIMHGEKLWHIGDAFFHYDECYIWDKHYENLFKSLKAEGTQFRIAVPESMIINCECYKNVNYYSDYKYYLAECSESEIRSIVDSMKFAEMRGESVKYRPHPRYTNLVLLRKCVPEKDIEMCNDVPILYSISNCKYAVGSYSTVLSQAFFSGKKVILDDITYKKQYEKLKNMNYILSEKVNNVLSNYQ